MRYLKVLFIASVLTGCSPGEAQPWGLGSSAKGENQEVQGALNPSSPANGYLCGFGWCSGAVTTTPENADQNHRVGSADQWNETVVGQVKKFQSQEPSRSKLQSLGASDQVQSVSFVQTEGVPGNEAAVEITRVVIPRPFAEVVDRLPPELWGYGNLDHWLGGERVVVDVDDEGRATKQYERMVLSPFPCDLSLKLSNNDMTKAEVIRYDDTPGAESATVYWRVYASDNCTVDQDYGSVDFRAVDGGTQVTFHSAHRLLKGEAFCDKDNGCACRSIIDCGLCADLVVKQGLLETMFSDFLAEYYRIVTASYPPGWIDPFVPGIS